MIIMIIMIMIIIIAIIITTIARSPGTTSVCFSVVTVNDEYRKPEFKIKRRG